MWNHFLFTCRPFGLKPNKKIEIRPLPIPRHKKNKKKKFFLYCFFTSSIRIEQREHRLSRWMKTRIWPQLVSKLSSHALGAIQNIIYRVLLPLSKIASFLEVSRLIRVVQNHRRREIHEGQSIINMTVAIQHLISQLTPNVSRI